MRIIGVIDLMNGAAVRASGGRREQYPPVERVAGEPIVGGDAIAVARAYVRGGVREIYAADLDAIGAREPQASLVTSLVALGVPIWLDAGVSSVARALQWRGLGVSRVVVGLETLSSFNALSEIGSALGGDHVAFSLDLRDGQPIVTSGMIPRDDPAPVIASKAITAGAEVVIVIDLARVGTNRGVDFELMARIRDHTSGATLIVGGGVRGVEDLERLAAYGCDGALVATALLEGRVHGLNVSR